VAFFESLVPLTIVDAFTEEDTTVIIAKEVNMVLRIRTVITKIKHYKITA
jgi:hypothetical protein